MLDLRIMYILYLRNMQLDILGLDMLLDLKYVCCHAVDLCLNYISSYMRV